MRIPRCHVDMALAANTEVTLPEAAARHLRQVLRLRPGDAAILFNGHDGIDYQSRLLSHCLLYTSDAADDNRLVVSSGGGGWV